MRMLLLGATGRLGAHLLRGGLDRVWEVTALSASPEKIKIRGPRLRIESGDPLDTATLDGLIGSHDAVVSALGPRKPQDGRVMSASGRALRASLSENEGQKDCRDFKCVALSQRQLVWEAPHEITSSEHRKGNGDHGGRDQRASMPLDDHPPTDAHQQSRIRNISYIG